MARFAKRQLTQVLLTLVLALLLFPTHGRADSWRGRELQSVIESLREAGLPILYSSGLVRPGMRVHDEPAAHSPLARLRQVLEPFGLTLRAGPFGSILIVRGTSRPPAPDGRAQDGPAQDGPAQGPATSSPVPELVVTTSRYELFREPVMPTVTLANTDVERLPDLGDDPLRAVARLPGAAANGLSSKTNVRGGAADELLITFDDMRLFNPFHLKDFQAIFSSIDPAVIEGLNVYTGAFPSSYGDRLSGVVEFRPFRPTGDGYRVLSLSLFNAAGLMAGGWAEGRGTWLVSARRGNLDIYLDLAGQDVGKPRYSDLHGQVAWDFSETFSLSANALIFDDNIRVFDGDREERAQARYHDGYVWLRADLQPTAKLEGYAIASRAELTAHRSGIADQSGVAAGSLDERRSAEILDLLTRWSLDLDHGQRLDVGAEVRRSSGRYVYADEVSFDLLFDTPGAPTEAFRSRNIEVAPDGEYYATFVNARLDLLDALTGEFGLRWERSTLVDRSGNLSPRFSLLYRLDDRTRLRSSWGRYWQSQGIDELPVSDGVTTFSRPERADQFVLAFERDLTAALGLRVEAYRKRYGNPRVRFENLLNSFAILPELKPDRIRVEADGATARGIEVSLRSRSGSTLDWWGSYSWSKVLDEAAGEVFRRSWDQSHAVGAGLLWSPGLWELSAAVSYRTGWPTTRILGSGDDDVILTALRNAGRLGSYGSLDLRAARRFRTRTGLVVVFAEVANALNRRNDCCVEYAVDPEDGFELDRTRNLPLLPSVGFSWQF